VKLSVLVAPAFLPVQASTGRNAGATKSKNGPNQPDRVSGGCR
jgi:hypothetical protein